MDRNRNKASEKLLRDVLDATTWGESNQEAKRVSLGAFRRARTLRAIYRRSAMLAVLVAAGVVAVSIVKESVEAQLLAKTRFAVARRSRTTVERKRRLPADVFISDQELIANFPPDSCFMAEVDGRKILVFRDEAVRREYFR
jgi:hypothetical protein